MGQRSDTRPAVQGPVPAHIAPDLGRRDREVPLVRHDPGRGAGLCEEARARFRREKVFDVIEATPDQLREVDGIGRRPPREAVYFCGACVTDFGGFGGVPGLGWAAGC